MTHRLLGRRSPRGTGCTERLRCSYRSPLDRVTPCDHRTRSRPDRSCMTSQTRTGRQRTPSASSLVRSSREPQGRAGRKRLRQGTRYHYHRLRSQLSNHRQSLLGIGCRKSRLLLRSGRPGSPQRLPRSRTGIYSLQGNLRSPRPLQQTSLLSRTRYLRWWRSRRSQPDTRCTSLRRRWSRPCLWGIRQRGSPEMERTNPRTLLRKTLNQPQQTACSRRTKGNSIHHC